MIDGVLNAILVCNCGYVGDVRVDGFWFFVFRAVYTSERVEAFVV